MQSNCKLKERKIARWCERHSLHSRIVSWHFVSVPPMPSQYQFCCNTFMWQLAMLMLMAFEWQCWIYASVQLTDNGDNNTKNQQQQHSVRRTASPLFCSTVETHVILEMRMCVRTKYINNDYTFAVIYQIRLCATNESNGITLIRTKSEISMSCWNVKSFFAINFVIGSQLLSCSFAIRVTRPIQ